jgi:hypothetical protein
VVRRDAEMLGREAEGDGHVEIGERLHLPIEPVERIGRKLSAQERPVRIRRVPSRFIHVTASSSRGSSKWNHCISPILGGVRHRWSSAGLGVPSSRISP